MFETSSPAWEASRCRCCQAEMTLTFQRPGTFIWYGAESPVLTEKIQPNRFAAQIWLCPRCGFMGQARNPEIDKLIDVIYTSNQSVPGATPGNESLYAKRLADDFAALFDALLPKRWTPEKVLEIGCQRGYLLAYFLQRGSERAIGVEPGAVTPFEDAQGRRMDVRRGYFSEELVAENGFALIYALQVFEHVLNPNEFLQACWNLLKPGGRLLLTVPNERFSLERGNLAMFLFQHMNYFTPATLGAVLESQGFRVLQTISSPDRELSIMAEKVVRRDRPEATLENRDLAAANNQLLQQYARKIDHHLQHLHETIHGWRGEPWGFYGVAALSNIYSWLPELAEIPHWIFDSDSQTWDKKFGGIPVAVTDPRHLTRIKHIIPAPFRLQGEITNILKSKNQPGLDVHPLYPSPHVE